MDQYAKYRESNIFEKKNKGKTEQNLMDARVAQDVRKIGERYRSRPAYLKAMAMGLAKHVLETQAEEENKNDLFS